MPTALPTRGQRFRSLRADVPVNCLHPAIADGGALPEMLWHSLHAMQASLGRENGKHHLSTSKPRSTDEPQIHSETVRRTTSRCWPLLWHISKEASTRCSMEDAQTGTCPFPRPQHPFKEAGRTGAHLRPAPAARWRPLRRRWRRSARAWPATRGRPAKGTCAPTWPPPTALPPLACTCQEGHESVKAARVVSMPSRRSRAWRSAVHTAHGKFVRR